MVKTAADLRNQLATLEKAAPQLMQEDTLRQRFVEALDHFLQDKGITKKGVQVVLSERLIRGRPDARLGAIVFEVKLPQPTGDGITAAIAQSKRYIDEFCRRHKDKIAKAVAYDGLTMAFLNESGEVIEQARPSRLSAKLESWLIGLGGSVVTPDDFVARLGPASGLAQEMVSQLWETFINYRQRIGFIDEAFAVWQSLYGAATNLSEEGISALQQRSRQQGISLGTKKDVEEYLFAVQTYLAILLKLLVVRVAAQKRLTPYGSVVELFRQSSPMSAMKDLERYVPRIGRVFEEDVFLWPTEASLISSQAERQLDDYTLSMAENLDDVDLVGVSSDFLRLVYQRFLDPITRQTLGEFYTSPELVDETLDAVGFTGAGHPRIADITCGSGTFLLKAIERMTQSNRQSQLLKQITSNVIGIDIHPFAVAMARVNYILGIADLLMSTETVPIPIYWANSLMRLVSAQPRMAGMRQLIEDEIPGLGKFSLPDPQDVDWQDLLQRTKEAIIPFRGILNPDIVWERFWEHAPHEQYLPYQDTIRNFVSQIVDRHNQNRDMRWLPLLRNTFIIRQLSHSCDFIVGNPPWVRIHNISPAIRERLFQTYEVCMGAGWRRGARLGKGSRGFARQVDYSIAFVERGMDLLKPGGRLGFVITSKIMHALYGNALRKKLLDESRLIRLVDYSLHATSLFEDATNYPLILTFEARKPLPSDQMTIKAVGPQQQHLEFSTNQDSLPLLSYDRESPWLLVPPSVLKAFRHMQGSDNHLRPLLGEVQGHQPQRGVVTSLNDVFIVKRVEVVPEAPDEVIIYSEGFYNKRLPEGERQRYRARIEKSLLRRLIRGENIGAWQYKLQDYIVWTHEDKTGKVLPDLPPKARAYFRQFEDKLRRRSDYKNNMPIWQIFRVSPEKLEHKVSWPELSNRMEVVYLPAQREDNLLGKCLTIPIQTSYILPVENEATGYVVAAWLNSLPVRAYVASFAERARGAYFRHISWVLGLLPVPEDIRDVLQNKHAPSGVMKELHHISEELHANPSRSDRQALEGRIDDIVATLYKLNVDEDIPAIRLYVDFVSGKGSTVASELLPIESEDEDEED
jgi:SAM-dependent methyltransferase